MRPAVRPLLRRPRWLRVMVEIATLASDRFSTVRTWERIVGGSLRSESERTRLCPGSRQPAGLFPDENMEAPGAKELGPVVRREFEGR